MSRLKPCGSGKEIFESYLFIHNMTRITCITADGEETVLENARSTLMEAAADHGAAGIGGECGGAGSCGTCHAHVAHEWTGRAGLTSEYEQDIINLQQNPALCTRFGCQIKLTEKFDGLVVRVPLE